MKLTEELTEMRRRQRTEVFSPEQVVQLDKDVAKLHNLRLIETSLQVGDFAPNFALTNADGELFQLTQLLENGAVVLSFYRGMWCPFCSLELRALEEILPAIQSLGASLVSISPQTRRSTRLTVQQENLTHPVLHDKGNQVARQFGIVHQVSESMQEILQGFGISLTKFNGDHVNELPVPATFIIDQNGKIAYRFIDPDFTKRLDPVEIITILSRINKKATD